MSVPVSTPSTPRGMFTAHVRAPPPGAALPGSGQFSPARGSGVHAARPSSYVSTTGGPIGSADRRTGGASFAHATYTPTQPLAPPLVPPSAGGALRSTTMQPPTMHPMHAAQSSSASIHVASNSMVHTSTAHHQSSLNHHSLQQHNHPRQSQLHDYARSPIRRGGERPGGRATPPRLGTEEEPMVSDAMGRSVRAPYPPPSRPSSTTDASEYRQHSIGHGQGSQMQHHNDSNMQRSQNGAPVANAVTFDTRPADHSTAPYQRPQVRRRESGESGAEVDLISSLAAAGRRAADEEKARTIASMTGDPRFVRAQIRGAGAGNHHTAPRPRQGNALDGGNVMGNTSSQPQPQSYSNGGVFVAPPQNTVSMQQQPSSMYAAPQAAAKSLPVHVATSRSSSTAGSEFDHVRPMPGHVSAADRASDPRALFGEPTPVSEISRHGGPGSSSSRQLPAHALAVVRQMEADRNATAVSNGRDGAAFAVGFGVGASPPRSNVNANPHVHMAAALPGPPQWRGAPAIASASNSVTTTPLTPGLPTAATVGGQPPQQQQQLSRASSFSLSGAQQPPSHLNSVTSSAAPATAMSAEANGWTVVTQRLRDLDIQDRLSGSMSDGTSAVTSVFFTLFTATIHGQSVKSLIAYLSQMGLNGFARPVVDAGASEVFAQGPPSVLALAMDGIADRQRVWALLHPSLRIEAMQAQGYIPVLEPGIKIATTFEEGRALFEACAALAPQGGTAWLYKAGDYPHGTPFVRFVDERELVA